MRIAEFRIPLPLEVNRYEICQLHMVAKTSLMEGNNVEIQENVPVPPTSDLPPGQYTKKILSVEHYLPGWLAGFIGPKWTQLVEDSWNRYPYLKTEYNCPINGFVFKVISHHLPGDCTEDNPLQLSPAELAIRKIKVLDIVADKLPDKDYNPCEDPCACSSTKTEGIIPLSLDWRKRKDRPIMTCYKAFIVHVPLGWGISGRVETFLINFMQKALLISHRRAVCWVDEWWDMSKSDIRQFEAQVQQKLNERRLLKNPSFSSSPRSIDEEQVDMLVNRMPGDRAVTPPLESTISATGGGPSLSANVVGLISGEIVSPSRVVDPPSTQTLTLNVLLDRSSLQPWRPPPKKPKELLSKSDIPSMKNDIEQDIKENPSGELFKLSQGILTRGLWIPRKGVLHSHVLTLQHVGNRSGIETHNLKDAQVTWLQGGITQEGENLRRAFAICLSIVNPSPYKIYLSSATAEEAKRWCLRFQYVSMNHKQEEVVPKTAANNKEEELSSSCESASSGVMSDLVDPLKSLPDHTPLINAVRDIIEDPPSLTHIGFNIRVKDLQQWALFNDDVPIRLLLQQWQVPRREDVQNIIKKIWNECAPSWIDKNLCGFLLVGILVIEAVLRRMLRLIPPVYRVVSKSLSILIPFTLALIMGGLLGLVLLVSISLMVNRATIGRSKISARQTTHFPETPPEELFRLLLRRNHRKTTAQQLSPHVSVIQSINQSLLYLMTEQITALAPLSLLKSTLLLLPVRRAENLCGLSYWGVLHDGSIFMVTMSISKETANNLLLIDNETINNMSEEERSTTITKFIKEAGQSATASSRLSSSNKAAITLAACEEIVINQKKNDIGIMINNVEALPTRKYILSRLIEPLSGGGSRMTSNLSILGQNLSLGTEVEALRLLTGMVNASYIHKEKGV